MICPPKEKYAMEAPWQPCVPAQRLRGARIRLSRAQNASMGSVSCNLGVCVCDDVARVAARASTSNILQMGAATRATRVPALSAKCLRQWLAFFTVE